jgi:hypothetical protein
MAKAVVTINNTTALTFSGLGVDVDMLEFYPLPQMHNPG